MWYGAKIYENKQVRGRFYGETYALKYAGRYKTKVEASYLKDVVVYFLENDELVPTAMYTTVKPFSEWYESYNKENEI